jgi:DNA (cytosine-5)-methyltransferase 1
MTTINQNPIADERPIDLLVGGTPCQSFSVAGLRKGLDDPRGNLMLTFLSIADKFRPKWVVWENVPGVLSSNGGKDFGTFLGALGELGYGFAYRVLDAQYFGVAQRRRRVFVVGYLGDWRVAAAVLFERESLSGNPKPSRKKREEVTANAQGSVGEAGSWWDGSQVAGTLTKQNANGAQRMPDKDNFGAVLQAIGLDFYNYCITGDAFQTVSTRINASTTGGVMHSMAIRRLTPKECERLQGFPDDWTKVPYRNKEADQCPDGPRYKACGNSMAVPVMRWIGERINLIESML